MRLARPGRRGHAPPSRSRFGEIHLWANHITPLFRRARAEQLQETKEPRKQARSDTPVGRSHLHSGLNVVSAADYKAAWGSGRHVPKHRS